jgi:hypothetical protein
MLLPVVRQCFNLHLFPHLIRHTSTSCCISLVWLVVTCPGASASPSCRASAWHLGPRHSSRLQLSSRHSHSVGCCFAWHLTPPSHRYSSRCSLLVHPSLLVVLSHCPVPRPIIWMVVVLPLVTSLPPVVRLCLSIATVLSVVCQLPPFPPSDLPRTMLSSPGCGTDEGASPSGNYAVLGEHHWRWAAQRASCDKTYKKLMLITVYSTIYTQKHKFW